MSLDLLVCGGVPVIVGTRDNFYEGSSQGYCGQVKDCIRVKHVWSLRYLVSLGLWFGVILLGRVHARFVFSWASGYIHANFLLLRMPKCAGVLRVAVLVASEYLRRFRRFPGFLQWRWWPVWWNQSYAYSLLQPVRNTAVVIVSEVVIVLQYLSNVSDLK